MSADVFITPASLAKIGVLPGPVARSLSSAAHIRPGGVFKRIPGPIAYAFFTIVYFYPEYCACS